MVSSRVLAIGFDERELWPFVSRSSFLSVSNALMTHSGKGVTRIPPCQGVDSKRMEVAVSGGVRSGVELSVLSSYGHIIAIRKLLPFDQSLLHRLPFCGTNYVLQCVWYRRISEEHMLDILREASHVFEQCDSRCKRCCFTVSSSPVSAKFTSCRLMRGPYSMCKAK